MNIAAQIWPKSWCQISYSNIVINISTNGKKLNQKQYLKSGLYPIIDQGQAEIGGYTNDSEIVINCDFPVIIFGDHTRVIKFISEPFVAGADGIKVLQPKKYLAPKLLKYFTQYLAISIKDKGYARHYQWIAKEQIGIPPLNEQHRIVSKIEELFSELDNGIESLKKAQEQLKFYRQSLLKHAFEGKLTEQWRKDNADKLESADQLLERIKHERESHYQQQLEEWEENINRWEYNGKIGKKSVKPRKPKWHKVANKIDSNYQTPNSWAIVKFENITNMITDGDHQAPPKTDKGIPFITISNIDKNNSTINFDNTFFVNKEYYENISHNRKTKIGDILYTVTGSFGIPVLIDFNKKFCFQRHIGLISPVVILHKKWLFYLLCSPMVFNQADKNATGTAQKTVALSTIRNFNIPLCSIKEQEELALQLEQKISMIDMLEKEINENLAKSEALRQSILKKAFSGQLVPQDPNDEPASILLERIKAEKAKQEATKKSTKRTKPKAKSSTKKPKI